MSDSYKLIYFNAKGVVEAIRIMFAIAGISYEDFRYPLSADFKRPEFDASKAAGELKVNMDRLPILVYNEKVF